jgi:ankyrin repeat protein
MQKLFRTLVVVACLLALVAMAIPALFGDKRPRIYLAAERGDTNYIADYLASGSNVNAMIVSYKNGGRFAPALDAAIAGGQPDAVDFLLRKGAEPNKPDDCGDTPLIRAIGRGQSDTNLRIIKLLLNAGADPNLRSSSPYGWTPLIWATALSQPEMVRMLVAAGGNVNTPDSGGATPLHHAENAEVARLLLAAGANPSATCTWVRGYPPVTNQATPADMALENQRFDVLAVLTNRPSQGKDWKRVNP